MRTDKVFFLSFLFLLFLGSSPSDGQRFGRKISFPKGASFVAAVALASLLPRGPTDGLAHVLEIDLGFPFPDEFSIGKKEVEKKKYHEENKFWLKHKTNGANWKRKIRRSVTETEKGNFVIKVERAIDRMGLNGSSCVWRLRCELRHGSPQNSLLEELLFALFNAFPQPTENICKNATQNCPVSLFHIIMHSQQVFPVGMHL